MRNEQDNYDLLIHELDIATTRTIGRSIQVFSRVFKISESADFVMMA